MRLPYKERRELPPSAQEAFDRIAGTRGQVLNVFKTLANSPGALAAVSRVGEFIRYESSLDPVIRELSILMVARSTNCLYEWTQHMKVARQLGVSEHLLKAVASKELINETGGIGAAARFVNVLLKDQDVDDELYRATVTTLGEVAALELTVLVGYYRMLAGVLKTFQVELEDGLDPIPFEV